MANTADKRGPRIGDSASLWNFTPSPGWTKEEANVLKLCLMRYGVGQWVQILNTGLLPGKLIQQLNGQTQRLLGQQSLSAYTGLKLDIDQIRADNDARTDVQRKAGLIIWSGPNRTPQVTKQLRLEAETKYSLTADQAKEVEVQMEEILCGINKVGGEGQLTKAAQIPVVSIMEAPVEVLSRALKLQVLKRLRQKLRQVMEKLLPLLPPDMRAQVQGERAKVVLITQDVPPPCAGALRPTIAGARPRAAAHPQSNTKDSTGWMKARRGAGTKVQAGAVRKRSTEGPLNEGEVWSEAGDGVAVMSKRVRGGTATAATTSREGGREDRVEGGGEARQQRSASSRKRPSSRRHVDSSDEEGGDEGRFVRAEVMAADVARLVSMGFPAAKAKEALRECCLDLETAIEWLFVNCS